MKIDLITPPSRNPVDFHVVKPLLLSKDVNIICREPLKIPFGQNLSTFIEKALYMKYVKSEIGKATIKHMITEGLCYMLHFIPMDNVVVTCHGLSIAFFDCFSIKNKFIYNYYLTGMKKADRIIAVSNNTKKELVNYMKYPEDRIDVIYHGIDHKIFFPYHNDKIKYDVKKKYNIGYDDKIILHVGSELPLKNIPTLIKAFYKLKKTIPNVKLIRAGPFNWKGARKKSITLIKQLHLEEDIIYVGVLPKEELPQFYNTADVFVCPSYYESFGIPNLEALACGCPVITTNKAAIPEVVGDGAIKLSDPFDVDLLARTMEEVLTNDGLREDLIKKSLAQAKKFSYEKYAKETYKVYERVWNEK